MADLFLVLFCSQATDFVTPAFAGYVSGHSAFSGAASQFLSLFFKTDKFVGPACSLVRAGESLIEPRISKGQPNYVPGLTDVPNQVRSQLKVFCEIVTVLVDSFLSRVTTSFQQIH